MVYHPIQGEFTYMLFKMLSVDCTAKPSLALYYIQPVWPIVQFYILMWSHFVCRRDDFGTASESSVSSPVEMPEVDEQTVDSKKL